MIPSAKTWEELLRLLDPRQPVPKVSKSHGAIEFWREWDAGRNRAVWGKTYRKHDGYDLAVFNRAEIEWLMVLADTQVGSTYRSARIEREGTKLAEPAQYVIKTIDCGPTIDDWLTTPVRVNGRLQAHCLVQPESFLRLALAVLQALDGVHACHFVHCDLHPGNITLPVDMAADMAGSVTLKPRWDEITLIDFGYSINSRNPPRTTLPIQHRGDGVRVSPHLRRVLERVEAEAAKALVSGPQWPDVWLDPAWWQRLPQSPLDAFRDLDWREDLYQLGQMLADIRDGVGTAAHLGGQTLRESRASVVNKLVAELPEELIECGLMQVGGSGVVRPHQSLMEKIQRGLNEAKNQGQETQSTFELHEVDFCAVQQAASKVDVCGAQAQNASFVSVEQLSDRPSQASPVSGLGRHRRTFSGRTVDLPVPDMTPLRVAAPSGWEFTVATAPVTVRQWLAVCEHNPELFRPPCVSDITSLPAKFLDAPIINVSYNDCLLYLDTLNKISGHILQTPLGRYRIPSLGDWALIAATRYVNEDVPRDVSWTMTPVSEWPAGTFGLRGVCGIAWQWVEQTTECGWVNVFGGPGAHQGGGKSTANEPIDQFPSDWRTPFVTLRLIRYTPAT